jgi:hypothetical protein
MRIIKMDSMDFWIKYLKKNIGAETNLNNPDG